MSSCAIDARSVVAGFRLGEWRVEPQSDRISRSGIEIHLRPRVVDLLVFLAGRSGRVVTRSEILDGVWSTRIVSESVLSSAIAEAREAFRDDAEKPWLIETIPKRGYRLLVHPLPLASSPSGAAAARPGTGPWPEGPEAVFVGRDDELRQLREALQEAREGRGRAVFVTGEPGSGKTALLAEFASQVLSCEPDVAVAGGRCPLPAGPAEPCLPFREALKVLSGDPDGGWLPARCPGYVPPALADWSRVLARALTGKADLLPGSRRTGPDQDPQAAGPEFLPGQVEETLRAFARERPLVLLLDDVHWADEGSLVVLGRLARQLPRSRILLVASLRREELSAGSGRNPLAQTVNELARCTGEGAFLALGAAPERAFLDALVDAAPNGLDERFREELFALTEGQPLFTIEVLRSLGASGAVAPDAGGRWIVTRPIDWRALPMRVEALVRDQVGMLDELSRAVLEAAAVEGEEFCAETVAAAIGRPLSSVVGDLSEVLRRQRHLVAPCRATYVAGRRLDLYRFRHALLRRYVYGRLDEAERALLHDRAAAAVRAVYGDSPEGERLLASHLAEGMRNGVAPPLVPGVA